jgi:hypothetical protein
MNSECDLDPFLSAVLPRQVRHVKEMIGGNVR